MNDRMKEYERIVEKTKKEIPHAHAIVGMRDKDGKITFHPSRNFLDDAVLTLRALYAEASYQIREMITQK